MFGMGVCRAQAGDDEEAVLPLAPHRRHLVAGADDAIQPGAVGEVGQAQRLIMGGSTDADAGEVALVQAGEHGDSDNAGVFSGSRLGVFHHRPAASGMHGDDGGLQHMDGLHRGGHGVGNVVQLQVEKDRQADLGDLVHTVGAMRAEEFQPQLQPADMRLHLAGQRLGSVEAGQVEGEVDGIVMHGSQAFRSVWQVILPAVGQIRIAIARKGARHFRMARHLPVVPG